MLSLYGRQWESSYGQIDGSGYAEWMESMKSLTTAQVKVGLEALIEEGNEFPPNLIKFLKLCRTAQPAYHDPVKALPKPVKRYSVMRIELAKQKALYGEMFRIAHPCNDMLMDWNGDDEAALCELIESWNEESGLEGLGEIIDGHVFSRGRI